MIRSIIAMIFLSPAFALAQSTRPDIHSAAYWLNQAQIELSKLPADSPQKLNLAQLVAVSEFYRSGIKWQEMLKHIEQLPDDKANFHLDVYVYLAEWYAQAGNLEAARESLDRAKDSPVARACKDQILLATLQIDEASSDFPAAMRDIQLRSRDDQPEDFRWLQHLAMVAHKPEVAWKCWAERMSLMGLDRDKNAWPVIARLLLQSGHTDLTKWLAKTLPAKSASGIYAVLAVDENNHGNPLSTGDAYMAIETAISIRDINSLELISNIFAIGNDLEDNNLCAIETELAGVKYFQLNNPSTAGEPGFDLYYYDLAGMQLWAGQFDAAVQCDKNANTQWWGNSADMIRTIARIRLQSGDIEGAIKMRIEFLGDAGLLHEFGRRTAELGKLELLQEWIDGPYRLPANIAACCGAAEGLAQKAAIQPSTKP